MHLILALASSGAAALGTPPHHKLADFPTGFSRKFTASGADQPSRHHIYLNSCDTTKSLCPADPAGRLAIARAWASELNAPELAMRWIDVIGAKIKADPAWDAAFVMGTADGVAKLYIYEALPELPVALGPYGEPKVRGGGDTPACLSALRAANPSIISCGLMEPH